MNKTQNIQTLFQFAQGSRVASAMAGVFGNLNQCETLWKKCDLGTHSYFRGASPVTEKSIFDLASMTKALVTSVLIWKTIEENKISLNSRLGDFFPNLNSLKLGQVTVASLLRHDSGLLWWHPFYQEKDPVKKLEEIDLIPDQIGKCVYSDLGFLWLQKILEKVHGESIDLLFLKLMTGTSPYLGPDLHFRNLLVHQQANKQMDTSVVATEICPYRGLLQGQVHDDNAYSLGGVCGHTGLFGTSLGVSRYLQNLYFGNVLSDSTLRQMWNRIEMQNVSGGQVFRTNGWDCTDQKGLGSVGLNVNHSTVGHLGFTGTSMWIELDTGRFAVLLTNRVHPSRQDSEGIRRLRRSFHDIVFE